MSCIITSLLGARRHHDHHHVLLTVCLLVGTTGCVAQKVYFDCGAKVDVVDGQGLILSPGFPYNYSSGTHCVWQFFVPVDHQLNLEIFDFDVFESNSDPSGAQYVAFSDFEDDDGVVEDGTFGDVSAIENPPVAKDSLGAAGGGGGDVPKTPQSSQSGEVVKQVVVQEQSTKMEIAKVSNSAKRSVVDAAAAAASSSSSSSDLNAAPPPLLLLPPGGGAQPPGGDKASNSVSRADSDPDRRPATDDDESAPVLRRRPPATDTPALPSPETQPSSSPAPEDACPHDVLYISDLITFSSRFCGSNRPPSSQLVFGSSEEMVEVIMELITTTHWGRGFALLFHYHNRTESAAAAAAAVGAGGGGEEEERHARATVAAGKVDSLLAAVSGAAFFAMILTSALCVIFRPKLCPKRANSSSSANSEPADRVENRRTEASELQLVAANPTGGVEETPQHRLGPSYTVNANASADTSQNAELELSSNGLAELDLGTDEVFIVSTAPTPSPTRPPFSPHTQRERFLHHSDTGPGPASDWPYPDHDDSASSAGPRSSKDGGCAQRPRAWSVRTFQDFLPPLPQLHKKWCSWNSTSPFTKLVDSAPSSLAVDNIQGDGSRRVFSDVHLRADPSVAAASDTAASNASYPLTQPAQRQRRLNSTSNLRRARFTGFGLLSSSGASESSSPGGGGPSSPSQSSLCATSPSVTPSGQLQGEGSSLLKQQQRRGDFPASDCQDHVSVQVFAISEEEDRQPLVLAEHVGSASASPSSAAATAMLNGLVRGVYEGKGLSVVVGSTGLGSQSQAVNNNGPQLPQRA